MENGAAGGGADMLAASCLNLSQYQNRVVVFTYLSRPPCLPLVSTPLIHVHALTLSLMPPFQHCLVTISSHTPHVHPGSSLFARCSLFVPFE